MLTDLFWEEIVSGAPAVAPGVVTFCVTVTVPVAVDDVTEELAVEDISAVTV